MLKKCFAFVTACALMCLLSGCFLLPQEAAPPALPLVTAYSGAEYTTATVKRGDVELYAKVSLTFYPTQREEVKFELADRKYGVIHVSVGDEVCAGDLLAELDSTAEEAALQETKQKLERLRIQLEAANDELRIALEEESLRGGSHLTSEARQADIAYYEACIAIQENQLAEQERELELLRIYAPIDGTVTYVKQLSASTVSSRNDIVVTIADGTSSVFSGVTEEYALFTEGKVLEVSTSGGDFQCVVRRPEDFGLSGETDSSGRRNVVLEILEGQEPPSGSTRGSVQILLEKREDVLMLPSYSVFTVGERSYVYHEDETGFKTAWEVQTGLDNGSWVEITGGLGEGEQIVVG